MKESPAPLVTEGHNLIVRMPILRSIIPPHLLLQERLQQCAVQCEIVYRQRIDTSQVHKTGISHVYLVDNTIQTRADMYMKIYSTKTNVM